MAHVPFDSEAGKPVPKKDREKWEANNGQRPGTPAAPVDTGENPAVDPDEDEG